MTYFFAVGQVAPPVKFDEVRKEARFTLRDKNNRLYVVTTTLSQYEAMQANQDARILIIGTVFSFRSPRDGEYRIGLKPMILEPINGHYDRDLIHRLTVHLIEYGIENEANGH